MNTIPTAELNTSYKDFYILLRSSLLGEKFDIIKCLSTRTSWTTIIKANGQEHSFAASIEHGIKEKWFVPFSHVEFAKLHVQAQQEAILKKAKIKITGNAWFQKSKIDKDSIINAYSLDNIK